MITRGGNILINEFLQREKNKESKQPGPMSSVENLNLQTEQENIIISNQERKNEILNPNHALNAISDSQLKR